MTSGIQPPPATTMTTAPERSEWSYARLWRRAPGNAVYLLAVFVLAMTAIGVLMSMFFAGVGLIILVIGLPLVVATLFVARGFSTADRFLLRLTALPQIDEPDWARPLGGTGFWQTLVRPLRNGHYWSALLHGAIVNPIIATVSFSITVAWLSVSLAGLTAWFWRGFIPGNVQGQWGGYVADAMPWLFGNMSDAAVETVLELVAGVLFAATLPWVLGALAAMHHAVATAMLGPWRSDVLAAEVAKTEASRGAAVQAEDASLRRLERDIHDGPQQGLIRLQMDLAAIERRIEAGDSAEAIALAKEARTQAKLSLDELRALSSGMAPPLLQDRGLRAALDALAGVSPLPVQAELDPTLDGAMSPEVERSAYFVTAELLANVAKHADATSITLRAALHPTAPGQQAWLELSVADNGHGGAVATPGHGLEGLRDRVQGLRGELAIDSPVGGPTRVVARIPLG